MQLWKDRRSTDVPRRSAREREDSARFLEWKSSKAQDLEESGRDAQSIRRRKKCESQSGAPATRLQALQQGKTSLPSHSGRYRKDSLESYGSNPVTQAYPSDRICSPSSGSR